MHRRYYDYFYHIIITGLLLGLGACSDRIHSDRAATLKLSVSIAAGSWEDAGSAGHGRFLTPDIEMVFVEARAGTAEGDLVLSTELSVSEDTEGMAEASGQLALPIGQPLVLTAAIRDPEGTTIAQAISEPITLEAAPAEPPAVALIILPLENNPDLEDLSPGANTVTIPAGKSRILRFSSTKSGALVKWAMGSYPDLKYQVRSPEGTRLSVRPLGEAPYSGVAVPLSGSSPHYVVVYNAGSSDAAAVPVEYEPIDPYLVAVNATGQAYTSIDGATWSGPSTTGLSTANDLAYANGLFIAVGQNGTNYGVSTSSDGLTWTPQNLGGTSAQLMRVRADSGGHLVATAYYGATFEIFNSDDGLTWTGPTASGIGGGGIGPAWTAGNWYIANGNLSAIRKSADGTTWATSGSASMYGPATMIGVNGRVILGGASAPTSNKQVFTSSDGGVTFGTAVTVTTTAEADGIQAFAADPTTFRVLAVGTGTTAQINYSDNYGETWTTSTGTGVNAFRAAAWWSGGFLAGDSAGNIYESTEGASFALAGSAGTAEIRGIAYNDAP